jgi:hypothetical protein
MAEANLIVNTPTELVQYLINKHGNGTDDLKNNQGDFTKWYIRTRVWYDPNVCKCKKKDMSDEIMLNEYRALAQMSTEDKEKAYRIIGSSATVNYNGEFVVSIP